MELKDGTLQLFNVDHGACALLTLLDVQGGYCRVLVDCGHSTDLNGQGAWYPGGHLKRLGVNSIDLLICTNFDEDHASGVPSLVQHGINVGCILGNPTVPAGVIEYLKLENGMGSGIRVVANSLAGRAEQGGIQTPPIIPNLELRWFWNPWPHWSDENNLSLVTHLSIYGFNFLFPGDLETAGWKNMLQYSPFAALMPDVDVLVAAHHGRANGKCDELFDVHGCNPALVVISDCEKRHQSQETVPFYARKARGVQNFRTQGCTRYVLTTRSDGEICFRFEAGNCSVF